MNAPKPNNLPLKWRHNGRDGVSNHKSHDCLLNRLFGRRSTKTSKLRVTVLCEGNSTVTGEFPAQMASNAENIFIWWRHRVFYTCHPGSMHLVPVLLHFVVIKRQSTLPAYFRVATLAPGQSYDCHLGNHTTTPVPVKQAWIVWVTYSQDTTMNWKYSHNKTKLTTTVWTFYGTYYNIAVVWVCAIDTKGQCPQHWYIFHHSVASRMIGFTTASNS